jgi:Flp pilus assembly protein TadD
VARDAFALAYKHGQRGAVFENDRGRLALATSDYPEAIDRFRAAVELRRDFMEARSNLAVAQRRGGDVHGAERTLIESLQVREDYAPVHFNLAEILREQAAAAPPEAGSALRARAREHYALALRYGYDPATILERRAGLASEMPQLGEAEQDLLQLTQDPQISGRILHRLARVKRDQGEVRIALQILLLAKERDYDAPELHSDLGELYLRSGDTAAARQELSLALAANPDLVVTRVNLSIALAMEGDLDAAERELAEAEKRDPEHPLLRLQRDSLAQQRGG